MQAWVWACRTQGSLQDRVVTYGSVVIGHWPAWERIAGSGAPCSPPMHHSSSGHTGNCPLNWRVALANGGLWTTWPKKKRSQARGRDQYVCVVRDTRRESTATATATAIWDIYILTMVSHFQTREFGPVESRIPGSFGISMLRTHSILSKWSEKWISFKSGASSRSLALSLKLVSTRQLLWSRDGRCRAVRKIERWFCSAR